MSLRVPDEPLTPAALFLGAAKVGSCSDVALDITSSYGSGGRAWVRVGWTVNGSLPARNLTALRTALAVCGNIARAISVSDGVLVEYEDPAQGERPPPRTHATTHLLQAPHCTPIHPNLTSPQSPR